jgi:hypothetical protein
MDKDVLVQYYCVLVDKYIASRTRNYQQHNKIDAMLVRGSQKKRLQLLNPGGLQPAEGLIALSDAQGNVRWDNLRIPTLNISSTYAVAGSLVLHLNNVYFSLIPGAEGEHISIPTTWKNLSSGSFDASVFSQDQIDALNLATEPSAGNPYATHDLQIISLKGTDQQTYY